MISKPVVIRNAVEGDEPSIRDCAEKAYQQYVATIGRKPAPMVADFASQITAGDMYVATGHERTVLGFIVFHGQGERMMLESVAVFPHASGQGIGKALIKFCEGMARRHGYGFVDLYTNAKMLDNIAMYSRLGYVEVGRLIEEGFDRIYFEKSLSTDRDGDALP